jgi:hypothetical protein
MDSKKTCFNFLRLERERELLQLICCSTFFTLPASTARNRTKITFLIEKKSLASVHDLHPKLCWSLGLGWSRFYETVSAEIRV